MKPHRPITLPEFGTGLREWLERRRITRMSSAAPSRIDLRPATMPRRPSAI